MKFLPTLFILSVLVAAIWIHFAVPEKVVDRQVVAATIYPIYDMTRQIAGDNFEVYLLLPPGASPHTFEPTPKTAEAINNSQVIFAAGILDEWAYKTGDEAKVMTINQGIHFLDNDLVAHKENNEENEHENEPHYWLNIKNAIIMSEQITEKLSEIDPENAEAYRLNLRQYIAELETTNTEITQIIASLPKKDIATFHNSMQYYADEYGLNLVAVFEEFPGQLPGPQYLAEFSNLLANGNIDAVFSEPQLPTERLRAIASEYQVPMGIIDPLGGVPGRETYIELMRYNTFEFQRTLQ